MGSNLDFCPYLTISISSSCFLSLYTRHRLTHRSQSAITEEDLTEIRNGCAWMFSRRFPTGILFGALPHLSQKGRPYRGTSFYLDPCVSPVKLYPAAPARGRYQSSMGHCSCTASDAYSPQYSSSYCRWQHGSPSVLQYPHTDAGGDIQCVGDYQYSLEAYEG